MGGFIIKAKYCSGSRLVFKFVKNVFPEVDTQLKHWHRICNCAPDNLLAQQAVSSITLKKFHAQGGSVYALYPNVNIHNAVRFIVALQTISDYLDNLCDRSGIQDERSFRQLHLSMADAVNLNESKNNYYLYYPYKSDNGYLSHLVEVCRNQIALLPSYTLVSERIRSYIKLYSDLQTYKHLRLDIRERKLSAWAKKYSRIFPEISWWEFSAAAGSTLGIFVLYAAASDPYLKPEDADLIESAYFPWICGLHILLDYYIDSYEDMEMGDLNFTSYYDNLKQCEERLIFFIEQSLQACSKLQYPDFHTTIIKGLLSMYLSDPKASIGLNRIASRHIVNSSCSGTKLYLAACRVLRSLGKL